MDDTLQRLLNTELRAETIAKQAETELERVIKDAMALAHADIEQFEAGIHTIHAAFTEKAELRASQAITEMKRRYDDRYLCMQELAKQYSDEALVAAFAFLIDAAADQAKPVN